MSAIPKKIKPSLATMLKRDISSRHSLFHDNLGYYLGESSKLRSTLRSDAHCGTLPYRHYLEVVMTHFLHFNLLFRHF